MFVPALTVCLFGIGIAPPPELVTARDVRSLPPGAARNGRAVNLRGTVTFSPHPHDYFYLQDATGGVRVEWPACDRKVEPGDAVEVSGVTEVGTFLPKVQAARVKVTPRNRDALPVPERFNLTTDEAFYLDGQWVTVEAVLQNAWTPDTLWLKVDLGRGRGSAVAYLPRPLANEVEKVARRRGAVVRVRGVWEWGPGGSNPSHLLVSGVNELEVVVPPEPPEALPLVTARNLAQHRHDPIAARLPVRVSGVVTLDRSGKQLFLQDDTGAIQIAYTNRAEVLAGQRVTAVGFPRLGTEPVRLDNAHIEVTDPVPGPLPTPHAATVAEATTGKLDGRVVTFTGTVLDTGVQGEWPTANVLVDGVTFTLVFLNPETVVEPGSRVRAVGVATRQQFDKFRPHTFAVIVRRGDLHVLEVPAPPPAPVWWTGQRVALLSAGFLGLFLVSGAGVTVLRLQVRRATALVRKESAEREKLAQQLKLAARLEAAGRLAGSIAHDFNNLLTVINGCAVLLATEIDGDNDPAHTANFAATIRRAGTQAATLTRQLLMFSRQRAAAPYPLDLNETLADAADMLKRLMGDRIDVRVVPAPGLPLALAEPGQLSQLLLNLAVNAADAMPGGGTFTLTTSVPEPNWVRLTATDTGTGMTDEVKAHVFESGFTTKAAGKGTGLGLATVHGIVLKFGGRIRFASELGRGTAFEIDLPAVAAPALPPPEHPTDEIALDATLPALPPRPAVVLLVEDEEAVCALLRHVLEAAGLTVLSTGVPDEALRLLAQYRGPLDLLVTDVVLPGLSGRQLADRVLALHPSVKVLFMSGYTADEISEKGVCEEQVNFLHKPFLPREFIEQVTRLLADGHNW